MTVYAMTGLIQGFLTRLLYFQAPFLHINWPNHRQSWQKVVQMCQSPRDFALALAVLESCIKPCVMNPVWFEALGKVSMHCLLIVSLKDSMHASD